MAESGIDLGFDFDIDYLEEMTTIRANGINAPNLEFYELKSRIPPPDEVPTFKTATPTSRTQLKLQLQREQQQQELERREAEKRALAGQTSVMSMDTSQHHHNTQLIRQQQNPNQQQPTHIQPVLSPYLNSSSSSMEQNQFGRENHTPALKVPLQSIGVDVPPQVLQVRTVLENPTRYHVIQKQKSQVRQFLSESFKQSGEWDEQIFRQNGKCPLDTANTTTINMRPAGGGVSSFSDQKARQDNNCSPMITTQTTPSRDSGTGRQQSSLFSVGNFSASASIGDATSIGNKNFSGSGFTNSSCNLAMSNNNSGNGNIGRKMLNLHCKSAGSSMDTTNRPLNNNNLSRGSGASIFSSNMTANASPGASAGGMSPSLSSVATSNSENLKKRIH